MADYITSAALKATLELTGTTYADADIASAITAASSAIDKVTDRKFSLGAAGETRYYTPTRPVYLSIDDMVAFTSLATDHDGDGVFERTWTQGTEFELWPLNASADGMPYEAIEIKARAAAWLPVGIQKSIKLVGQFGWSAIPTAVSEACTILATRLVRRKREAPFGVVGIGFDSATAVRIARTDPDIFNLIDPLSRRPIIAAL